MGARQLSLTGYRVDGSTGVASVATAIPSREPKHLQRLLADKAAALDPEFGFDAFALTAGWTEDLGAAQENLVEELSGERELARLVDRLTVKLGPRAVRAAGAGQKAICPSGRAGGWRRSIAPLLLREREGAAAGCGRVRACLIFALHPLTLPLLRNGPLPLPQGERG